MSMTISISSKILFLVLLALGRYLLTPVSLNALPSTTSRVPEDSFLVASLNMEAILKKSKMNESKVWRPLIDALNFSTPQLKTLLFDKKQNSFNFKIPVQLFVRTSNSEKKPLSFGVLTAVQNIEKVDQIIANFAESMNFTKQKGKNIRYRNDRVPIEFGRKGKVFHIIGMGPIVRDAGASAQELDNLSRLIFSKPKGDRFPDSLKKHFSRSDDLSVYIDGSGFANVFEENWPDDQWKTLLPLFDPFFTRQYGLHMQSNIGSIKMTALEYSSEINKASGPVQETSLLDKIPGDSPLVIRLSLPSKEVQQTTTLAIDQVLQMLSNGKINKDSILPGFNATPAELLTAPSGDFIFAGGHFNEKNIYQQSGKYSPSLSPSLLIGVGIDQQLALKQLLAGLNSVNSLRSLLDANQLHLTNLGKQIWLTSIDYLRELKNNKPLTPLSKNRKKILNKYSFALDLNVAQASQSIRKHSSLSFPQLKMLNIADDFSRVSSKIFKGELVTHLRLIDTNRSGLEALFKHIGQGIIDQANQEIFQAIAQDNLNLVIQAVQKGSLINATDRFGHSPLHYAAYKGNPRIVDHLLNNGGNPNIRGRHESTPLHSAAWGRNIKVLELLLEDGADVDAKTDEGETPGMTAALRGEKEMLEILFALSADPHAKDIHGTNFMDLAAAGGHKDIVSLLKEIGVINNNPLHIAAGLGDLKEVKKLLNEGYLINDKDAFGATPLLVAMVSGKEEIIDFLLSKKANPYLSAKDGYNLMHGAAFSGKKNLVRKALSYEMDVNSRYGPDGVTPVDVADETGDALPFLRALGGKTAWELGRVKK